MNAFISGEGDRVRLDGFLALCNHANKNKPQNNTYMPSRSLASQAHLGAVVVIYDGTSFYEVVVRSTNYLKRTNGWLHYAGVVVIRQKILLANHQDAEDQQRAHEALPPVMLSVTQLRMVRGSAEDPADLDLPTPGCAAARSWRSAALTV